MHYAKAKFSKLKDSSKEWLRVFQHHYLVKKGVPRSKLTTLKGNILCSKEFSKEQLDSMELRVFEMLENETCPIENPIPVPPADHLDNVNGPDIEEHVLDITGPGIDDDVLEGNVNVNDELNEVPVADDSDNNSFISDSSIQEETVDERKKQLEEELLNVIEEVRRMTFDKRPTLIKLKENKKFKDLSSEVQEVVRSMSIDDLSIDEVNIYNFGCALYVQRKVAPWLNENKNNRKRAKHEAPPWKKKINKIISQLRAEISQMTTSELLTRNAINRL